MGKIILFSPNIIGEEDSVIRMQPPHGLGLLASFLEMNGHDVYVRNTALEGYYNRKKRDDILLIGEDDDSIKEYIKKIAPEIIGISIVYSNLMKHTNILTDIAKEINPNIKVVVGGNHITLSAQNEKSLNEIMKNKNIDYGMIGECDHTFPLLVSLLLNNKDEKGVDGLIRREGEKIIVNKKPAPVDITNLPFEARDKMNMEKYFEIGLFHSTKSKSKRVLTMMASRGCPENCKFCSTPKIWGRRIRWRNPENIYEEIVDGIKKYGIKEVQFSDDCINANKENLIKLCDLIKPLDISWCTPNGIKINYQTGEEQYELFRKMKDSGCYQISFGCESGVQRVLDEIINKNIRLEQINPAINNAKRAGLRVHLFWIVGFPGETRKEMGETIEFASRTNADSHTVSIFNPLPSTELYEEVCKKNLWWKDEEIILTKSPIKVDGFNNAKEFENWVNEKNIFLNSLLKGKNPELFSQLYKSENQLKKQI